MSTRKLKQPPSNEEFIPHLAYDSVIFGFNGKQLKILVLEYHNTGLFAIPGGFVKRNEDINDAVKRGLKERTGLSDIYLEQFHTFGSVSRSSAETMREILINNGYEVHNDHWLFDRFVSIAYYALINYEDVQPRPDELSDSINWYAIDDLPPLMMDHRAIVDKALENLRENLDKKLIGMNLLPAKFTMKDLQTVYEAILGEKLRRTTFQRKILAREILIRHEKLFTGGAHKAPYLYSFKDKNPIKGKKYA
ncbi:NUDIX hydrolase [Poritiphilus flavus]|uniref:NUDIX domain-containing protein n=1 Tax=Poritiphilus flavus TaxID=2697053 RepID=A0A6L9EC52_9FLAO|nr:NUDIX domain-containing protein [Poritiphilus flavus]NAS12223.1 NUDIX domain-containing protein [Poritiphilus flavus]